MSKRAVEVVTVVEVVHRYISAQEIADQVGVSKRVVNYWLSRERKPGKKNLAQLRGLARQFVGGEVEEKKEKPQVKTEVLPDVKPSKELMKIQRLEKPSIPDVWDYEESLKKVKSLIFSWGKVTYTIAFELYIAREKLSLTGGVRTSGEKVSTAENILTWTDYCERLGYTRDGINKLLKRFFGGELEKPEEKKELPEPEEETIREQKVKCFAEHYSSKDPLWISSESDCQGCLCLSLCRQVAGIWDKDRRFEKIAKAAKNES